MSHPKIVPYFSTRSLIRHRGKKVRSFAGKRCRTLRPTAKKGDSQIRNWSRECKNLLRVYSLRDHNANTTAVHGLLSTPAFPSLTVLSLRIFSDVARRCSFLPAFPVCLPPPSHVYPAFFLSAPYHRFLIFFFDNPHLLLYQSAF